MSEHKTYKCDVCGKTKGESNHWFQAYPESLKFTVFGFDPMHATSSRSDLCGEDCLLKWVSQYIGGLK